MTRRGLRRSVVAAAALLAGLFGAPRRAAAQAPAAPWGEIRLAPAEIEAAEPRNRLGIGVGAAAALWAEDDPTEPIFLGEERGGLILFRLDYLRDYGRWFGIGGAFLLAFEADSTGLPYGVEFTGLARLWALPGHIFLQLEASLGYPSVAGLAGTFGLVVPLGDIAALRIENRLAWTPIAEDPFHLAWTPLLGAELRL